MPIDVTGIQNFYDAARTTDFSRNFQFRVLQLGSNQYTADIEPYIVFMTTASLPNRTINNQAVPYMGLQFNVPGSVSYTGSDAWNVTFRCPQDFSVRSTLEQWQINIFDDETSSGDFAVPARDSVIHLALLNNAGTAIREYVLYGCYIQALGEVAYDITGTGAPVEFTAVLAYQYWRLTKALPGNVAVPAGSQAGISGPNTVLATTTSTA